MESLEQQSGLAGAPAGPELLQTGLMAAFFVPGTAGPDLSLRSLSVLLGLGSGPVPRTLGSLGDELGLGPAQIRGGIAALERSGLVRRLEGGAKGRGVLVVTTAAGARLVDAMTGRRPGGD